MRDRSQLGWLSNLEKTLFEISSIYSLVGVCKLRNLTSSILIRLMHLIETLYVVEPPFPRLLLHWKFLSDVSKIHHGSTGKKGILKGVHLVFCVGNLGTSGCCGAY